MHFNDEDEGLVASSGGESVSEVMEMVTSVTSKEVNHVTIMTFPEKWKDVMQSTTRPILHNQRVNHYNLANSLGLSGEEHHQSNLSFNVDVQNDNALLDMATVLYHELKR